MAGPQTVEIDVLSCLIREAADYLRQLPAPPNYILLGEHTVLKHRANILSNELRALRPDDHRERDAHRHKVRQLVARLQAHLSGTAGRWLTQLRA